MQLISKDRKTELINVTSKKLTKIIKLFHESIAIFQTYNLVCGLHTTQGVKLNC